MSAADAVSRAFAQAVELSGAARRAFMHELRREDAATAEEVASLLGYHDGDSESPNEAGSPASGTGLPRRDAGRNSVLDRPAAAMLGLEGFGVNEDDGPIEDDPPLPAGTLLSTEGLNELDATSLAGAESWSYRILGELGRGGMGVVYEAEQAFPSRRVALKLLRGGVGRSGTTIPTGGSLEGRREGAVSGAGSGVGARGGGGGGGGGAGAARRLMLEVEALGALHHPGIAQVYAAGTLRLVSEASGQPLIGSARGVTRWLFISMELVEGPTLGEWGRDKGIREKVAMVAGVCDAVEHAHQRGVVHRDLKPGNVLIETGGRSHFSPAGDRSAGDGGEPGAHASTPPVVAQPKVLDFGVARLTGRNRAARPDATLNVGRGQLIGTLRYMSPEQARGGSIAREVDSRSDVYSLGALLYELVTGSPPIPVDDTSIVGAVERITSATPARPKNLAGLLGRRSGSDLETVLFKALEKEPAMRYQHAMDLGDDLRRVLADEPIAARPPTGREQLLRLVRRNKVASTGVGAGVALLFAGLAVATWQAVLANRAAVQAREEASVSSSALYFMGRMINAGTPREMRGQDVTVREMLRSAVREVRSMPDDRATATACRLLAEAIQDLGEPAEAEPLARRSLAIDRELLGDDARETIESGILVAHITAQRGRLTEALSEARAWRERCVRLYGADDRLSLRTAMALEYALSPEDPVELAEAESLLRDTIERSERVLSASDRNMYTAKSDLCALLLNSHRAAEALPIAQEIYNARVASLGEDHPETILSLGNLTAALADQGMIDRALELNAKNVELAVKVLGPDHPGTQYSKQNLAQLYLRRRRFKDAEAIAKSVWDARSRRLGPDTRLTMGSRGVYIASVLSQGRARFAEVEPMIRDFISRNADLYGPNDDDTLMAITLLYDLAEAKEDKAELDAVTRRLKGTRFDPAVATQLPPVGTVPDASGETKPTPPHGAEKP